MWSSENWLQELVQCLSCNSISSKKDIFWHLESFIYEIDVSDIMKIHGMKYIPCPCCRHETRFIYGNEYTDDIRKRLLDSIDSFLVVAENYWNPVWWLLWYIPNSFEEMYQLEFKDHYANIGVEKIKNTVNIKLNWEQNNMLMFAAVWFLDKYRNPFHLIEFLRLAYVNLPKKHYGLPWIKIIWCINYFLLLDESLYDYEKKIIYRIPESFIKVISLYYQMQQRYFENISDQMYQREKFSNCFSK